jgi:propionyl-CoA carboxylase beta chain
MWDKEIHDKLKKLKEEAAIGGGQDKIDRQHQSGKLTARERLELLFDEGTFTEINDFVMSRFDDFGMDKKKRLGDGVVTGYGKVGGRLVFASSEDFTVMGGSVGEYHAMRICKVMDMALAVRAPFVSINDSGGARIEEGITALSGYGDIFFRNTKASGVIPQIAVIMGPCAGGACYSPAICDFVFMVDKCGYMFITGPQVIETVTGEKIDVDSLGGAGIHMHMSGVAHFAYPDDESCLAGVRQLLSYLPQSNDDDAAAYYAYSVDESERLEEIVPANMRKSYDVKDVIETLVDRNSFLEVQSQFAKNIVVGFARFDGETVGIVANQPNHMGGSLDYNASDKAARFIRFCDCFNIPLLTFVDVPAFLPGTSQEHNGIIRHGAKLLYAYCEATVPKITLIMRKAYGGAYIAMNSKSTGADIVYAWPIARLAVMGSEGAVNIVHHKRIQTAADPEGEREMLIEEYRGKYMNPYEAAHKGYVDEVIEPNQTRARIKQALEMTKTKRSKKLDKKHGNIPL